MIENYTLILYKGNSNLPCDECPLSKQCDDLTLKIKNDELRIQETRAHSSLFTLHSSLFDCSSLFTLHLQRQSYTPRFRPCRHLRTYEDLRRHSRKFEDF